MASLLPRLLMFYPAPYFSTQSCNHFSGRKGNSEVPEIFRIKTVSPVLLQIDTFDFLKIDLLNLVPFYSFGGLKFLSNI